ncbi:LysM peptidoglycan-binding domain-containing protein [Anoxybacillus rupiensis]|uniref:LysM peptidoglycan-binding domain-containing protein n=1 Tax=Anoxybacteroides rupiense TaxID=311460 RepID=A0ABD5IWJ6_9BACL|nr:LysM peptidoglycan-binding domain-containing protein [Anoxybacillus rupiensis]
MKRLKKKVLRKVVLNAAFGLSFWIAVIVSLTEPEYKEIQVKQGDSLWEIAKKYEPYHHLSNEEFVKWVEHRNNIVDGRVYPGEKIVIPVEKKGT